MRRVWVATAAAKATLSMPSAVSRRQQDAVVPGGLGGDGDGPAVVPAAGQAGVGDAEELVVVVAQRAEPGDFGRAGHGSTLGSGRRDGPARR